MHDARRTIAWLGRTAAVSTNFALKHVRFHIAARTYRDCARPSGPRPEVLVHLPSSGLPTGTRGWLGLYLSSSAPSATMDRVNRARANPARSLSSLCCIRHLMRRRLRCVGRAGDKPVTDCKKAQRCATNGWVSGWCTRHSHPPSVILRPVRRALLPVARSEERRPRELCSSGGEKVLGLSR